MRDLMYATITGLIIFVLLLIIGSYWERKDDKTIQEALTCIGDKGGTIYLRPGDWLITDRMVDKIQCKDLEDTKCKTLEVK